MRDAAQTLLSRRERRALIRASSAALCPVSATRVRHAVVMRIAVLTFDGFNEIDSFVVATMLNRLRLPDGKAVCDRGEPFDPDNVKFAQAVLLEMKGRIRSARLDGKDGSHSLAQRGAALGQ